MGILWHLLLPTGCGSECEMASRNVPSADPLPNLCEQEFIIEEKRCHE